MARLLLNCYDDLVEICLWVILLVGIVAGYRFYGFSGAIGGAGIAFVSLVLGVTPFLQLSDIRKRLITIEATIQKPKLGISYDHHKVSKMVEPNITSLGRGKGNNIKTYKGYAILKEVDGVSVLGEHFSSILKAEKYIDNLN